MSSIATNMRKWLEKIRVEIEVLIKWTKPNKYYQKIGFLREIKKLEKLKEKFKIFFFIMKQKEQNKTFLTLQKNVSLGSVCLMGKSKKNEGKRVLETKHKKNTSKGINRVLGSSKIILIVLTPFYFMPK